jgi:hypothetical protein
MSGDRALQVLIVSSTGGVLLDVLGLSPWWSQHTVPWAVVAGVDTAAAVGTEPHTWVAEHSARRPATLLRGLREANAIISDVRPDVIVSAGTGAAVPFFVIARIRRITTFWVSTLNLVDAPGLAARICSRVASAVFVQRSSLGAAHAGSVVIGELY